MAKKTFYLTTTLPYVNADPHIGFALEITQADIIARFHKSQGEEVFFNTGTDEHGIKIYRKAVAAGISPQEYVDEYAAKFRELKGALNLSEDINFIRTTDPKHKAAAREFWKVCDKNGHIYKKNYKIKYCVGCELEKTDSELEDGKCPIHPTTPIELIDEENYFFRFSAFQEKLLRLYEEKSDLVAPDFRFNEIKSFVKNGLEDFSISRLKSKMPWGVPVPGDDNQVMYVWFDALVNYISAIGWPEEIDNFNKWWPVTQFAGKDNLRQQSAMWQAMLMAAELPPSKQIVIHGFINVNGQKMSKSLGNVINPYDVIREYGADALRYFLARHINPFEDSDFTLEKFNQAYNANLANGLGNLVSRVMKMAEICGITEYVFLNKVDEFSNAQNVFNEALQKYEFNRACDVIWGIIGHADKMINEWRPFETVKTDKEKAVRHVHDLLGFLSRISIMLAPIMPSTSVQIKNLLVNPKMPEKPLFERKD